MFWRLHQRLRLNRALRKLADHITRTAGDDLISLYLGGSIRNDTSPKSDIDLYGIMQSSFTLADSINQDFKMHPEITEGFRVGFKPILINELKGGKPKSPTAKEPEFRILVRYMPGWHLVRGKEIDFSRLPLQPMAELDELKFQLDRGLQSVSELRVGTFKWGFGSLVKSVFHCAKLEAVLRYGLAYDCTYYGIVKKFRQHDHHIVHAAWRMRHAQCISSDDEREFTDKAQAYFKTLKEEFLRG